ATVTATNNSKTYGASEPGLSATQTGFTAADAATIVLSATRASGEAATTYVITPAATGTATTNYTITLVNGTFAINKALATVTATNNSKTYGERKSTRMKTSTVETAYAAASIMISA